MDAVRNQSIGDDVRSTAVTLRPHWRRRLTIIVSSMLAVCLGAGVWGLLANARSEVPQSPDAVVLYVLGSLGPYANNDQARKVMTGDKISDVLSRLRAIRQHLMSVKTNYELEAELTDATPAGDNAVVVAQVYDLVDAPGNKGPVEQSATHPWTFETVHRTLPEPGWFMTDFTAPDECRSYIACGSATAQPSSAPSGPMYPAVYLTCTRLDPAGVEDKVVNYEIDLDGSGQPDFIAVWRADNASCTADALHPKPVVTSPVEQAAVRASGSGTKASQIGELYAACAERFDLMRAAGVDGLLGNRVGQYRGVLVLCPQHPDANAIRSAVDRG